MEFYNIAIKWTWLTINEYVTEINAQMHWFAQQKVYLSSISTHSYRSFHVEPTGAIPLNGDINERTTSLCSEKSNLLRAFECMFDLDIWFNIFVKIAYETQNFSIWNCQREWLNILRNIYFLNSFHKLSFCVL